MDLTKLRISRRDHPEVIVRYLEDAKKQMQQQRQRLNYKLTNQGIPVDSSTLVSDIL